jgi:hypothetical protein
MVTNPVTESPGIGLQQVESCSLIYLVFTEHKHVIIATQYLLWTSALYGGPTFYFTLEIN